MARCGVVDVVVLGCFVSLSSGVLLASPRASKGATGCSDLVNHGSHFTVDVEVGTPGQLFSVVADTGSNTLIVPSCVCQQKGKCPSSDRCFVGTNKSSSFKVIQDVGADGNQEPVSMVLSFGSGQIQGVVVQDQVHVGGIGTYMDDGLLIMTDRALNIQGAFEGILGLGIPQSPEAGASGAQEMLGGQDATEEQTKAVIEKIIGQAASKELDEETMKRVIQQVTGGANATQRKHHPMPPGVLQQASVNEFSMCFNSGSNGVLRMGKTYTAEKHGSVGTQHWGVGFEGVSVGDVSANVTFCSREAGMQPGQITPCGAIPDSGTTLFMAPAEHVKLLLENVCDKWDRCAANYTKFQEAAAIAEHTFIEQWGTNPFEMKAISKADVLQMMLSDCSSWMTHEKGLDELPSLHFHVVGSNGTKQVLEIPSHSYILQVPSEEAQKQSGLLQGVVSIPVGDLKANGTSVCSPAFGVMDYPTKANGPAWILGTSLFYEYVVGYDSGTTPPSISFTSQKDVPCGSCSAAANLAAADTSVRSAAKLPRHMSVAPRLPSIDVAKPF